MPMSVKKFHEIFEFEVAAISKRREKYKRPRITLEQEGQEHDGTPVLRPALGSKVVGLALSGGGIRSSAFCLGTMQALHTRGLIDKIDYLSTVSSGGYIGTSMTAAMSTGSAGKFPFASELRKGEVPGVWHIRDHSNYLFPQGPLNIFGNVVVYLRGIVANAVLLLPWLFASGCFHDLVEAECGRSDPNQRRGILGPLPDFGSSLRNDAERTLGLHHPFGGVGVVAFNARAPQYF